MTEPDLVKTLASYVPTWVARQLAANPQLPTEPKAERFQAAVLFADISGFTPLAEQLSARGPAGAEELTRILNAYFGQLIDLVLALGGDVLKFAGDGALALWPATEEDLAVATRRAAQCSLAFQMMLHNYEAVEGVRLSMRIGIAAGEVVAASFGGLRGRWEFLIAGQPLIQMGEANRLAKPGEVVLSSQAHALVQEHCIGQILPGGGIRLQDVRVPLPLRPPAPLALAPEMMQALRCYVPGAILSRLDAGQTDWLAELRRVTVLFVNLPAVPTALEIGQIIMHSLQTILYRYEGSVRQFMVDDKGATLIAVLGLPPLAHEDDAARGVQTAIEMSSELRRLGLRGAIGVTTGQVYCGLIGNERRREYAIIGDVVNLSARLMGAAGRGSEKEHLLILCDEATYRAARARIEFEALPEITVKGKAQPLPVYRPVGRKKPTLRPRAALVGRTQERILLADALQALLVKRAGQVILLEGEAGIGKSRLVQELYRQAEAFRVTSFYGAGNAIEYSTPYYAWRDIFTQLLELGIPASLQTSQQRILGLLEGVQPGLGQLAPLLNPILQVEFPDNELTAQMSGQVRADNTIDLLLRLLQNAAGQSPTVIILEDAQWIDTASWGLAALVSQRVQPVLLTVSTRPLGAGWQLKADPPPEYQQLLDSPGACHIRLGELEDEAIIDLVSQRLGAARLSEPLVNLMMSKAEGHPFFAEELAYALRDGGLIQIVDDECRLAQGVSDWRAVEFPHTVQGAITSRIDRLRPAEQLTLKVASIIGRVFDTQLLCDIYPIEGDKAHLMDYLRHLEQLDLISRLSPECPPDEPAPREYAFKHAITRDVTYNLMPYSQRQSLHRAAALWHERAHPERFYYGVLVHHWTQAGDVPKALDYLERAGQEALRNGAHQEAVHLFNEALALDGQQLLAERQPVLRRARWERLLGEAYWDAGNVTASYMQARQAMESLGQNPPATRAGLLASLAKQMLAQAAHRLWPAYFVGRKQGDAWLLELGRMYYRLEMIHYMYNQPWQSLNAILNSLNLAESANPQSLELAFNYVGACIAFGVLALHPLAQVYRRLAQAAAQTMNSLPARAYMLEMTGLYDLGLARWDKAKAELDEAIALYDQLGNWHSWGESLNMRGLLDYYRGVFAGLLEIGEKEYNLGSQRSNVQMQTWGLNFKGMHAAQLGQFDQAIHFLESSWDLLTQHNLDRITAILNRGVLAVACLRQGKLRTAREVVYNVAQFIERTMPIWVVSFDGYAAMAQVQLALWENAQSNRPGSKTDPRSHHPNLEPGISNLKSNAHKACQSMRGYARVFSIGRPRAALYQGWYDWLDSNPSGARRAWRKSIEQARKLDMPYEEGLAQYELGRHAAGAEGRQHLAAAAEIFEQVGAVYDLGQAKSLLAGME